MDNNEEVICQLLGFAFSIALAIVSAFLLFHFTR